MTRKSTRAPAAAPRTVVALALVLALAAVGLRPPAPAVAAPPRPNIVFILTDDLSWDLLRFMPHVRALQRDGLTFSRYYVSDSLCCPSRASILTGRFPHNTHIVNNTAPGGGAAAFRRRRLDRHTFGVGLERAGYRTGFMGKYLNDYRPRSGYLPPGWSQWVVPGNAYREFGYTLSLDGYPAGHGWRRRDYLTDVLGREARGFVAQSAFDGRPFMLELSTFAPHRPATPAPRDRHRFPYMRAPRGPSFGVATAHAVPWQRRLGPLDARRVGVIDREFRRRARSVLAVDRVVGLVRGELRARGLTRDTYVVFSSDNGYHLGQHRLVAGKMTAFEPDIRVPLIVAGPGIAPARTTDALSENVDLAPTFLRLGGAAVPPSVDGHELVGLLHGARPADWRDAVLVEHHRPQRNLDDPDLQPRSAGNPPTYKALRTRTGTYVEYVDGAREYYDDMADPAQVRNVYDRLSPGEQTRLHATLRALGSCRGPGCWADAKMRATFTGP
jgi:N-acetylglucosamine-6-sulfatase